MVNRRPTLLAVLAAAIAAVLVVAAGAPAAPPSASSPFTLSVQALRGATLTDLYVKVSSTTAPLPDALKEVQVKVFAPDGSHLLTQNFHDVAAPQGLAAISMPDLERNQVVEVKAHVKGDDNGGNQGNGNQNNLEAHAKVLLRPDLVVEEITPQQTLVGRPVVISAVIAERNGDVGANAVASMSAIPGSAEAVVVPPGERVTVKFAPVTFTAAVPVELTVRVDGAVPAEADAANNARTGTLEVTEHELPIEKGVLFPSLGGYGAQFNMHMYAPITPWPAPRDFSDAEAKIKKLEPQLVRIFYNEDWDANRDGRHPEWRENYASFVKSVQLAQEAGATIDVSYQSLSRPTKTTPGPAMAKYADVLEELVRTYGLVNVRWAEIGNEPNAPCGRPASQGGCPDPEQLTLEQYEALCRALDAELNRRGLSEQIQLMGGGLVESAGLRHHYVWLQWIAEHMGDVVDAYAEHIYWVYDGPGRLEYRLRDTFNLMRTVLPAERQKPNYMMEFGVRGYNSCPGKPTLAVANQSYYRDASCTDIWRTNIAGFQQLWFNIHAAQLGVAGTSKWDAFWARYDGSSVNNQYFWMVGPPTEGSPLTPSYHAMSLLFHTTEPGWEILRVDPWDANDYTAPGFGGRNGDTSDDVPEKELVGYAGPNGELTIIGLDTNGRALNTASPAAPPDYSIGGLEPNRTYRLAIWNATGDGTTSPDGSVTANGAGVARFSVPLQAAFALTTVPVS